MVFIKYTFEEILPSLNLKKIKSKYFSLKEIKENFEGKIEDFLKILEEKNLIVVRGIYKFLKARKKYNSIILCLNDKEIKLKFPRQKGGEFLCLSDFLDKKEDSISFFILTSGEKPLKEAKKLKEKGALFFSYFLEIIS